MSEKQEVTAEERAKTFVEKYGELVKKHQIDFASYPSFVPDGQGGFRVTIVSQPMDITPKATPSPAEFVEKEK